MQRLPLPSYPRDWHGLRQDSTLLYYSRYIVSEISQINYPPF